MGLLDAVTSSMGSITQQVGAGLLSPEAMHQITNQMMDLVREVHPDATLESVHAELSQSPVGEGLQPLLDHLTSVLGEDHGTDGPGAPHPAAAVTDAQAEALLASPHAEDQQHGQDLMQQITAEFEQKSHEIDALSEQAKAAIHEPHGPGEGDGAGAVTWFTAEAIPAAAGAHADAAAIEGFAEPTAATHDTAQLEAAMHQSAELMEHMTEILKAEGDLKMDATRNLRGDAGNPEFEVVAAVAPGADSAAMAVDASATTDPHTDHGSAASGYKEHSVADDHAVDANVAEHASAGEEVAEAVVPAAEDHAGDHAGDAAHADAVPDATVADAHTTDHAGDATFHAGDGSETGTA